MNGKQLTMPTERKVTIEEVAKLLTPEAIYVNKFYVTAQMDGLIRIVFADTDGPNEYCTSMRASIILTREALVSLRNIIESTIQKSLSVIDAQSMPLLPAKENLQ